MNEISKKAADPNTLLKSHKLWHRSFLLSAFIASLVLCLTANHSTVSAHAGWFILTALFMLNKDYQINSIFFFAAFFMPANIAHNPVFTLKHFHIAILLSLLVQLIKGSAVRTATSGFSLIKSLWPIGVFILLAGLSSFKGGLNFIEIKLLGNFCLVQLCVIYLLGLSWEYKGKLSRPLAFFICGFIVQIVYGFCRDIFFTDPLNQRILHNNHLGVIAALLFFYCLPLGITQPRTANRFIAYGGCGILLSGILFSCSRTAWISTLAGLCIFIGILSTAPHHHDLRGRAKKVGLLLSLFLALSLAALFMLDDDIHCRMLEIAKLFQFETWTYTLQDRQNFGFLGIFRLNMLHELKDILSHHPLLGIGLTHSVVGFHGLYFTVLGSSGIIGLIVFVYFFYTLIRNVLRRLHEETCPRNVGFYAGTVASLSVWYLSSFMETLFLQFSVWIPVITAILLAEKKPHKTPLI